MNFVNKGEEESWKSITADLYFIVDNFCFSVLRINAIHAISFQKFLVSHEDYSSKNSILLKVILQIAIRDVDF